MCSGLYLNGVCDIFSCDSADGLSTGYSFVGMGGREPMFGVDCQGSGLLWYLLRGTYSLLVWDNKPSGLHIGPLMADFLSGQMVQLWSPVAFILSPGWTGGLTCWGPENKDLLIGVVMEGKPGIVLQRKELILLVIHEWSDTSDSRLHGGIYGTACISYSGGQPLCLLL